jgi:hypothetical protein
LISAELYQRERTQKALRFAQWSGKPNKSSLFEEYRLDFYT